MGSGKINDFPVFSEDIYQAQERLFPEKLWLIMINKYWSKFYYGSNQIWLAIFSFSFISFSCAVRQNVFLKKNSLLCMYLNLGILISKAYCNTADCQIFCNFGWWGKIPALSLFWRPSVVVEQNYPPVHPVMIPERSLEVHTVRVAIYQKSQEYFDLSENDQLYRNYSL